MHGALAKSAQIRGTNGTRSINFAQKLQPNCLRASGKQKETVRERERVRVRGKGDNLKSKVHKSRKYDFLFGDDEQKDNFLNQTDRERETETATETQTESERERDSSKMSMTQRRTTWCWQCVCGGLEAHPACLCKIQAK